MSSDCRPIITKSRHYSNDDKTFTDKECRRLLKEGVIENCHSPWKAQVVVVKRDNKKRLAINYSQTINRFILLDAFPLPNIRSNGNNSNFYNVSHSVPQGSVLGPILFLLNVNHLPNVSKFETMLFANDTNRHLSNISLQQLQ